MKSHVMLYHHVITLSIDEKKKNTIWRIWDKKQAKTHTAATGVQDGKILMVALCYI